MAIAWEAVIVSAFAELGDTKYEKKISNGKKPDIFFFNKGVSLLADVVTVSDDQQHKKNPVEDFSTIIMNMWKESGLQKGSLSWRVEGVDLKQERAVSKTPGCWGPFHLSSRLRPINRGSLKRLALPPANHLSKYLHEKVYPFFQELQMFPDRPTRLDIDEEYNQEITVRFSLSYTPRGSGLCGSYPSYTTITDIEGHVLWRRLSDKIEQFSLAKEELPRVLFVCDGGCAALHESSVSGPNEYRCEEMLDHFWKRPVFSEDQRWSWMVEKSISGVVVLPIVPINDMAGFPDRRGFMLKPKLYSNPHSCFPLDEATVELLKKVVLTLPVPVESPSDVMRAIRANKIPSRRLGVFAMSHNSIEMSGVELLRILSGELSLQEFCRNNNLQSNPFKDALMRFQAIKSVKVEPVSDRDDDKIIIEFSSHDPALGPFIVPESSK